MALVIFMHEIEEVKHPKWRNDKLISDAHNALNLLMRKGYLSHCLFGFTGWIREVDGTTCKIMCNADYDGKVICALLKLYFPNREFEVI